MSNASRKTSIPSKIYSKVKYRRTTFFSRIRQTNSQNFPPESRTTTDVRKFNLESLTIFKGCLKIFNFPAKKLRKIRAFKISMRQFFIFNQQCTSVSISKYFICSKFNYLKRCQGKLFIYILRHLAGKSGTVCTEFPLATLLAKILIRFAN